MNPAHSCLNTTYIELAWRSQKFGYHGIRCCPNILYCQPCKVSTLSRKMCRRKERNQAKWPSRVH